MRQVAEFYGLQVNRKGLCQCPFHHDTNPSLKIYPDGKGFYCFTCGTGGDQIKFTALYRGISNTAAARELAAAFDIPVNVPVTYREKREAEKIQRRRRELAVFIRRSRMYLTIYRGLLVWQSVNIMSISGRDWEVYPAWNICLIVWSSVQKNYLQTRRR